ncbi:hypothetical protein HELRODRAFT_167980 [Helobdella robusta]|uniref:Uncharacterized protein n=1 Tax=Helobdella robusta TaxID=6412 RepID=T1F012_HELRO|nr:hypothetical protein HELRODRAFT_167980 [Helobdella robusta]ESO10122.1 hypothetical protein HELRODRAFT_167980 [Helobdella robusta]
MASAKMASKKYTVNEVLSMLEDETFLDADVILLPPSGNCSDEDSGDEESTNADNLRELTSTNKRVSIDVRTDRIDHFQSQLETQKRCAHCHKNTRKGCKKCNIGLHDMIIVLKYGI